MQISNGSPSRGWLGIDYFLERVLVAFHAFANGKQLTLNKLCNFVVMAPTHMQEQSDGYTNKFGDSPSTCEESSDGTHSSKRTW